jgi:hypothetical protein
MPKKLNKIKNTIEGITGNVCDMIGLKCWFQS